MPFQSRDGYDVVDLRVLVCDEGRLFADGLACLLREAGCAVAAPVESPAALVTVLAHERIDACVVNLAYGGRPDTDGIRAAVDAAPGTRFLLLTELEDASVLRHALASGVHGIALKRDDTSDIVAALAAITRRPVGRWDHRSPVLSTAARRRLTPQPPPEHRLARFLTPRERETLVRLVQGETTAAAARSMGVRVSTARTHVDGVLTKLGVHTRAEAVAYAVREGLVDLAAFDTGPQAAAQ
jgi:two-component system nitrate/nitrite response regulator NarL